MVIGHAVGLTLIFASWLFRDYNPGPIRPAWLLLVLAGITLLFAARYSFCIQTSNGDDEWDELDDMEYDSLYDETSLFDFYEDEESENYSQWLTEKLESRREEQEERIERREDEQADEILEKLHRNGIGSISDEEKSLLHRVSARIRRRRQSGV